MGETGAKLPFERKGKGMREREISDFKERAEHGAVLMPIRRYRFIVPNTYQDLSLHWHEEAEIGWIQEGEIDYDINFESFRVRKGDLLLIAPHILHAAHAVPGKRMVSESLVFHLDMLGYQTPDACTIRCISPLQNGKYRFVPVVHSGQPGYGELIACMEELLGCMQPREDAVPKAEEPAEELYRKELLFRLFRLLYRYGYVVKNEGGREDFAAEEKMKQVLTFIRSHYAEALTVGQLAGLCHFSETYFMSFFKRFAGMTCVEYINHYRLSQAARILVQTDRPVTEAALENGFRNISYFNRQFRRQYGTTPREYRKAAEGRP